MFPNVNKYSFCALKRFCQGKNFNRTKTFINNTWDNAAINYMMTITMTLDLDSLTEWLICPDLREKLIIINNYFNQNT